MRAAIPVVFVLLALACQSGPRHQMLGSWQFDRAATLDHLAPERALTETDDAQLVDVLGKLTVRYERDRATSSLAGWSRTWEYRVIREGPNFVDIRHFDPHASEWPVRRVWVEEDRMWVVLDQIGIREYFERVPD